LDGDGWQDIYLCNLQGRNRLYRNLGDWRFEEMDPGDAACLGQFSTGATFADVDGDGHLDLLVNGIAAGTRTLLNDGKGHFNEVKDSAYPEVRRRLLWRSRTSMATATWTFTAPPLYRRNAPFRSDHPFLGHET